MTDLKELVEREIDQYLEWPTADKSHVTTVSAKLFAEHVATLYADHIPDDGKMAEPAVRGEPDDSAPVAAQHRFRHPQKALQDWSIWQPARITLDRPSWEIDGQGFEVEYRLLYAAPQHAEQRSTPDVSVLVEALEDIGASWHGVNTELERYMRNVARRALAAHQKRGEA